MEVAPHGLLVVQLGLHYSILMLNVVALDHSVETLEGSFSPVVLALACVVPWRLGKER